MTFSELSFNENKETNIYIKELNSEICLYISDGLFAFEEDLTEEYMTRISNFINCNSEWYNKSVETILEYVLNEYQIKGQSTDLELVCIYVLFEQDQNELYGLGFRAEFDIEHGCGLKIKGNTYEIVEVGTADIAFC